MIACEVIKLILLSSWYYESKKGVISKCSTNVPPIWGLENDWKLLICWFPGEITGCSAVGSALRSGRRSRQFESGHPDRMKWKVKSEEFKLAFIGNELYVYLTNLNSSLFTFSLLTYLSGWPDSNWRLLRPERSALPTALHPAISSGNQQISDF